MVVIFQVLSVEDKQDREFSFVRGLLEQELVEPENDFCQLLMCRKQMDKTFLVFQVDEN